MNEQILNYLVEIEILTKDINMAEINNNLAFGTMNDWLSSWHNAMQQCINNIKEQIK